MTLLPWRRCFSMWCMLSAAVRCQKQARCLRIQTALPQPLIAAYRMNLSRGELIKSGLGQASRPEMGSCRSEPTKPGRASPSRGVPSGARPSGSTNFHDRNPISFFQDMGARKIATCRKNMIPKTHMGITFKLALRNCFLLGFWYSQDHN